MKLTLFLHRRRKGSIPKLQNMALYGVPQAHYIVDHHTNTDDACSSTVRQDVLDRAALNWCILVNKLGWLKPGLLTVL